MCDTVKGQNSVSVIQESKWLSQLQGSNQRSEREKFESAEIRAMKKDKQPRHVMSDMITPKSRTIVLAYKLKKQNKTKKRFI